MRLTPLTYRHVLLFACWLVCLGYARQRLNHAWIEFADKESTPADLRRGDGNSGHAQIDFGGQWVMGRMVLTGHARELYDRNRQWSLVREAFPEAAETPFVRRNSFPRCLREPGDYPDDGRHDAEALMFWFMGNDSPHWTDVATSIGMSLAPDAIHGNPLVVAAVTAAACDRFPPSAAEAVNRKAVGGPLYPPIHGFLYAPLALLDPQPAYYVFQALSVALTFAAGLGVSVLSRGRIWWPVATTLIFLYPGYRSGLDLGQNQVLSLTLLTWGWVLAVRGREGWGGAVWGLMAFKPVWAAAFLLVPLLMRRWRFCAVMVVTGGGSVLATLPFTGVQSWLDWLAVGKEASELYLINKNWVFLSRDLGGLPRRLLIDFTLPDVDRGNRTADAAGWGFWFAVFATTVGVYRWQGNRRARTGLSAGFLFLGAYLCCYRFMYYDALLSVLPVAVLFADPRLLVGRETAGGERHPPSLFLIGLLAWLLLMDNVLMHLKIEATFAVRSFASTARDAAGDVTTLVPTLTTDTSVFYPWDTFVLLMLWGWCGYRLVRYGDPEDGGITMR